MIDVERRVNVEIVKFSIKKINALVTEELKDSISKVFEQSNVKVILDLSGVEYIDSSGFGCMLSLMRTARDSYSQMKIACPEPSVMALFETLHLETIFEIHTDLDECVRSFN